MAAAQQHPEAIAAMGEPIEAGFMVTGSFNFSNGNGEVDLHIPVSGPKASGSIHVLGKKESGAEQWVYETSELTVEGVPAPIQLDL